jgi:TatD DNase family protein
MLAMEARYPQKCISMMGLHPCSVLEKYDAEMRLVESYLGQKSFVAIGETGLDYYWDLTYKEQQAECFQRQIDWAKQLNIPIVIHSRNSTDECITMIEKNKSDRLRGVFHCFSGNLDQAKRILDLGFYLGIGGVLTFKNSGLDKVIAEIGLEQIVLETDAPYLAPVPYRGKRNEPSYLSYVVDKLALIKEKTPEEIGVITTANAAKLFKLSL